MRRREFIGLSLSAAMGAGCSMPWCGERLWKIPTAAKIGAPDYWCTWDTQGALAGASDGIKTSLPAFPGDQGRPGVRDYMNEDVIFGKRGLAYLYPETRKYLSLVLDDGWDVPYGADGWRGDMSPFSTLVPDPVRFPSLKGTPSEKLRQLARRAEDAGWHGLGLWVACQASGKELFTKGPEDPAVIDQLKRKLEWCAEAGITYWKVDWGRMNRNAKFRGLMTELKNKIHPTLVMEHCRGFDNALNGIPGMPKNPDGSPNYTGPNGRVYGNDLYATVTKQATDIIAVSDTFRTYDVANPMTTATALDRAAWAVDIADKLGAKAIVNIEDETVAAICLGLATGVMRSALNRSYAKISPRTTFDRLKEIDRAVRWRQLAPAFGSDRGIKLKLSDETIEENWHFEKDSTWLSALFGHTFSQRAAARMSRGTPLPVVKAHGDEAPFVVASKSPDTGAVSIGVLPILTMAKGYHTPKAEVSLDVTIDDVTPLAVFGEAESVTVCAPRRPSAVYVADLAGGEVENIASQCVWESGRLVLPGKTLAKIGSQANGVEDKSSPGVMIRVCS